jgi:hypothetical protein
MVGRGAVCALGEGYYGPTPEMTHTLGELCALLAMRSYYGPTPEIR